MFEGWDNFYIIVGPTAGALIGLMFVVMTLTADSEPRGMERGSQVYITPIVFHFAAVLVLSAITAVPRMPVNLFAAVTVLIGASSCIYAMLTTARLFQLEREKLYVPDLSDKLFYGIFPSLVYAVLIVTGGLFLADKDISVDLYGTTTLVILLIGVRNAWDLVTAIVKSLAKKRAIANPAGVIPLPGSEEEQRNP